MAKTITSEIKFLVELDENRIPEKLTWTAQDGGVEQEEAKAMMVSLQIVFSSVRVFELVVLA